jgi:glutamyl-tRNA synthetase
VLHELGADALRQQLLPLWAAQGWGTEPGTTSADAAWQSDLCSLIGPSLSLLADGVEQARPFFTTPELQEAAAAQLASEGARPALAALLERLPDPATSEPLQADQAQTLLTEAAAAAGVKKGVIMKSLRAALLGSLQGPDLLATWLLLHRSGADRARISRCL